MLLTNKLWELIMPKFITKNGKRIPIGKAKGDLKRFVIDEHGSVDRQFSVFASSKAEALKMHKNQESQEQHHDFTVAKRTITETHNPIPRGQN